MRKLTMLVVLTGALLTSCGTAPATDSEHADLVFTFIVTGTRTDLGREEAAEIFAGHFANMTRLAEAGDLLLAGPLGPPRVDPGHRGIFVFDTSDPAAAAELAATDPGARADVFAFEHHRWRAGSNLRTVPARDTQLRRSVPADAGPGATARPWFLVRTADAERTEFLLEPLLETGAVPVFGTLVDEATPGALFVLDATTLDDARAMLAAIEGAAAEFWTIYPWFATKSLADLRAPKLQ